MVRPILWHFQGSHFCEKARWALDFKGIPHVRTTLGGSYLLRAWWRTGRATLPVLIVDSIAISDSTRIIAELEGRWPNPPLYPRESSTRRRALELEDYFDEELGPPVRAATLLDPLLHDPRFVVRFATLGLGAGTQRLLGVLAPLFTRFYRFRHGIAPEDRQAARAKVTVVLDRIQAERQPSGYLVGEAFSVADLTASSLLGALLGAPGVQYPLPAPLPESLLHYREELLSHPAVGWVFEMHRRHRGVSSEVPA